MIQYINELLVALKNTTFQITSRDNGQETYCFLYDEGIQQLVDEFAVCKKNEKKLFFIGNGGSAGIANHMSADYLKNGLFRVVDLYNSSTITCLGNDYEYSEIFSKQIEMLGEEDDVLVAISSSGNSNNIVKAILTAQKRKMKVITFTGFESTNRCRKLGHYNVHVPINKYGIVESIHQIILQEIVDENNQDVEI